MNMKSNRTTRKRWINETGMTAMTARHGRPSREHKKKAVNLLNGLTASNKPAAGHCHKTVTSSESYA